MLKFPLSFFALNLVFFCLLSCQNTSKPTDHPRTESTLDSNHNASNSLDWAGTYFGIIPAASSPGIEIEIQLKGDHSYQISQRFQEPNETANIYTGKFVWEGNKIKLEGTKDLEIPTNYQVEENQLRMLDTKGNKILGDLADAYIISKIGNRQVEDKKWKIISLMGKKVEGSPETHYLIFHSNNAQIESKAGCNQINYEYRIYKQAQILFKPGAMTMMACPDATESQFINALSSTDYFLVSGNKLSFFSQENGKQALAIFELVP